MPPIIKIKKKKTTTTTIDIPTNNYAPSSIDGEFLFTDSSYKFWWTQFPDKYQTIPSNIPAYTEVDEQILAQVHMRWQINQVVPICTTALTSTKLP